MVRLHASAALVLCFLTLASGQELSRRTDRENWHLLGPVKSVHTLEVMQPAADGVTIRDVTSDQEFDHDGWLIETRIYGQQNSLDSRVKIRRDGPHVIEQDSTIYQGPRRGRTVATHDATGRVTEITKYTLDGKLLERTTIEDLPDGILRTTYDATGRVLSDSFQHLTRTATGFNTQTTTDGIVVGKSNVQRTNEGSALTASAETSAGHLDQKIVHDREGIRNVHVGPNGHTLALATDANGRTSTLLQDTRDGHEIRSVQHFDADHRLTVAESYADDVLRNREEFLYENDEHGNWVRRPQELALLTIIAGHPTS